MHLLSTTRKSADDFRKDFILIANRHDEGREARREL